MSKSIAIPLVAVLGIAACGGDAPPPTEDEPATMEEAMAQATEAIRAHTGDVEPMSAEELQERLPEAAAGLPRVDVSRTETGAMGMKTSTTLARYEDGDGRRVTIAISDIGGVGSMGVMGAAGWAMTEFDRTTRTGYDRTGRFEGFKTLESLSREGGTMRTELNIIVADRFIVKVEGRDVEMDDLKDAARRLGLRSLAAEG